jgi:outer membrane biosynthesis protein TonB
MPFQFYCPQGHLLEGHESQQGQQSQCPLCGAMFLIPVLAPQAAPQQQPAGFPAMPSNFPAMEPAPAPPPPQQPPPPAAQQPTPPPKQEPPPEPAPAPAPPPEPRILHIPCPKGHELETPSDMIGQQALCPYCNTQFELRYEDSTEHAQEQIEAKKRREEEINKLWVKWSIRAAIFVLVMFVGMMIYAFYFAPG